MAEILHGDIQGTIGEPSRILDTNNVIVSELHQCTRLVIEVARVCYTLGWNELHGPLYIERVIMYQPHFTEVASTQLFKSLEFWHTAYDGNNAMAATVAS